MDGSVSTVDTTWQAGHNPDRETDSETISMMRRLHLIEIHEQSWFPSSLRDYVTAALQFGFNLFKVYTPAVPLLQRVLDSTGGTSIIDMCSGGGGPWLHLGRTLQSKDLASGAPGIQIWLTDKYPNLGASPKVPMSVKMSASKSADMSGNLITFYGSSVDAMSVPPELKGMRTMFTSFHHFAPEEARAILQNAVDAGESIGIFEVTGRALPTLAMVVTWAFLLSACTPWIRPFRWSRLFWTYLVPIIPLVLLFDGIVSCLRTYRPGELREMVAGLTANEYRWEIDEHSGGRPPVITYLIGYPRPRSVAPPGSRIARDLCGHQVPFSPI
jgi:hypothetical protein